MQPLYFVTGNDQKVKEAQMILGFPIEIYKHELIEIQSLDVEKIVRSKAQEAYNIIKKPLFVDDVGLYIEAWNNFPGPLIKHILSAGGTSLLIKMMQGESNRSVLSRGAIAYHDGKEIQVFIGETRGCIASEEKGERVVGWEPIFVPEGYNQTYAEMPLELKNSISHRKKALEKFREYLTNIK
jgi:non-canonical purine NTP pyrophosphatase (RdgB/HAM1 family)